MRYVLHFLSCSGIYTMDHQDNDDTLITLTADIVAAHVSNNSVAVNDLPQLIANVHGALSAIGGAGSAPWVQAMPMLNSMYLPMVVCW